MARDLIITAEIDINDIAAPRAAFLFFKNKKRIDIIAPHYFK